MCHYCSQLEVAAEISCLKGSKQPSKITRVKIEQKVEFQLQPI